MLQYENIDFLDAESIILVFSEFWLIFYVIQFFGRFVFCLWEPPRCSVDWWMDGLIDWLIDWLVVPSIDWLIDCVLWMLNLETFLGMFFFHVPYVLFIFLTHRSARRNSETKKWCLRSAGSRERKSTSPQHLRQSSTTVAFPIGHASTQKTSAAFLAVESRVHGIATRLRLPQGLHGRSTSCGTARQKVHHVLPSALHGKGHLFGGTAEKAIQEIGFGIASG